MAKENIKKIKNETNDYIDDEALELPETLVENIICKQLLDPLHIENAIFVKQHFKAQWFKNESLITLFSFLMNYWKKYETSPTKEVVFRILENDKFKEKRAKLVECVNYIYGLNEQDYDHKFLQDTLIAFTKRTRYVLCYFG